jgi:hypothetical protein
VGRLRSPLPARLPSGERVRVRGRRGGGRRLSPGHRATRNLACRQSRRDGHICFAATPASTPIDGRRGCALVPSAWSPLRRCQISPPAPLRTLHPRLLLCRTLARGRARWGPAFRAHGPSLRCPPDEIPRSQRNYRPALWKRQGFSRTPSRARRNRRFSRHRRPLTLTLSPLGSRVGRGKRGKSSGPEFARRSTHPLPGDQGKGRKS